MGHHHTGNIFFILWFIWKPRWAKVYGGTEPNPTRTVSVTALVQYIGSRVTLTLLFFNFEPLHFQLTQHIYHMEVLALLTGIRTVLNMNQQSMRVLQRFTDTFELIAITQIANL